RAKGFEGKELEMVVNKITSDKQVWLDTMMTDELGMSLDTKSPVKAALSTLIAYVAAGSIPLVVYMLPYSDFTGVDPFILSSVITSLAFVFIGYVKTYVTQSGWLRSISETLLLGASAALAAYFLGDYLEKILT